MGANTALCVFETTRYEAVSFFQLSELLDIISPIQLLYHFEQVFSDG
jgi:hypothetical protein